MIDELKSAGLFGAGLVPVSGSLARRYNGCLELLGIAPTVLERFHVDGLGWSPEIAKRKTQGITSTQVKQIHMPSLFRLSRKTSRYIILFTASMKM